MKNDLTSVNSPQMMGESSVFGRRCFVKFDSEEANYVGSIACSWEYIIRSFYTFPRTPVFTPTKRCFVFYFLVLGGCPVLCAQCIWGRPRYPGSSYCLRDSRPRKDPGYEVKKYIMHSRFRFCGDPRRLVVDTKKVQGL